ncbi:unnamed protein product, partial [Ectocarpus sp. 12 AP-2014]
VLAAFVRALRAAWCEGPKRAVVWTLLGAAGYTRYDLRASVTRSRPFSPCLGLAIRRTWSG